MKSRTISFAVMISLISLVISPVIYSQTCIQEFAPKPPLGFNSFDSYRTYLSEEKIYALMDVLAERYLPFGCEYFVINAGWVQKCRTVSRHPVPQENHTFTLPTEEVVFLKFQMQ